MQDYFDGNATGAAVGEGDAAMTSNGGAVQPAAASGDTGMEDEILVRAVQTGVTTNNETDLSK